MVSVFRFPLQPQPTTATSSANINAPCSHLPNTPPSIHLTRRGTDALLEPSRPSRTAIIPRSVSQFDLTRAVTVGDEELLVSGARRREYQIAPVRRPTRVFV